MLRINFLTSAYLFYGAAFFFCIVACAHAQDLPATPEQVGFAELKEGYAREREAVSALFRQQKNEQDFEKAREALRKLNEDFASKFLRLANIYPNTEAGFHALVWASINSPESKSGKTATEILIGGKLERSKPNEILKALDAADTPFIAKRLHLNEAMLRCAERNLEHEATPRLLSDICVSYRYDRGDTPPKLFHDAANLILKHFADQPDISHFAETFIIGEIPEWTPVFEEHLRVIAKKNQDPLTMATSRLALAIAVEMGGPTRQEEAIELYKNFVKDFHNFPDIRIKGFLDRNLVPRASDRLLFLTTCGIGMPAPEIDAQDTAGAAFKLADEKGKVVIVVFWSSRTRELQGLFQSIESTFAKYRDRPIRLIGINIDYEPTKAQEAIKALNATWRTILDGREHTTSRAWHISKEPTIFLIDHAGIIRYRSHRGKDLSDPLEKLIAEAEAAAKQK